MYFLPEYFFTALNEFIDGNELRNCQNYQTHDTNVLNQGKTLIVNKIGSLSHSCNATLSQDSIKLCQAKHLGQQLEWQQQQQQLSKERFHHINLTVTP
jgi:hypothetical protein